MKELIRLFLPRMWVRRVLDHRRIVRQVPPYLFWICWKNVKNVKISPKTASKNVLNWTFALLLTDLKNEKNVRDKNKVRPSPGLSCYKSVELVKFLSRNFQPIFVQNTMNLIQILVEYCWERGPMLGNMNVYTKSDESTWKLFRWKFSWFEKKWCCYCSFEPVAAHNAHVDYYLEAFTFWLSIDLFSKSVLTTLDISFWNLFWTN